MMRYKQLVVVILLFVILWSCGSNKNPNKSSDFSFPWNSKSVDTVAMGNSVVKSSEELQKITDQLDQADLHSLIITLKIIRNSTMDSLSRDSMAMVFTDLFQQIAANYPEGHEEIRDQLSESEQPSQTEAANTLKKFGYRVIRDENGISLDPQHRYILDQLGNSLTTGYRQFLTLLSSDQQLPYAQNAKLLISNDSLVARLQRWEDFMQNHPGFVSLKVAQDQYALYLEALLSGLENSPVFDRKSREMSAETRQFLTDYLSRYPDRKSSELIKEYLTLLGQVNYTYSEKIDSFLLDRIYR